MKTRFGLIALGILLFTPGIYFLRGGQSEAAAPLPTEQQRVVDNQDHFDIQILVDGRPLEKYYGNGRVYIEALRGAEYEVSIRNPLPVRVAVALSVDGLNSIDARRTSAWNASKWVIGPYETITIGGWQMSSERARRFYFTNEGDSYAAKLGQTANLGLISAVFFRERGPRPVKIVPPPVPQNERGDESKRSSQAPTGSEPEGVAKDKSATMPRVDDDYAATGIGRSVRNDVRWIDMELDSRPAGSTDIRYEYYSALVRLGIHVRPYPRPEPWPRRERATGFEDRRFSPEP
jgi:hypothetical protein